MEFNRELPETRDIKKRIDDYKELYVEFPEKKSSQQAARCMDCGIPFCHNGCPLGNNIPEFNDAVYQSNWKLAIEILQSTNNFPEFTGRICPAPCEASCVLGINKTPVAIEHIEKIIAEKAFELGYIKANPPKIRTGKLVAVVGSGPAGLAAAAQLNKAGHTVTVFERDEEVGGLLRFGIPDFKLEKTVVKRRVDIMIDEGVVFKTNANVGVNVKVETLKTDYDAILLCGGSTIPRDLPLPGRNLRGIHFAMDFLTQQNKVGSGIALNEKQITATSKNVVVLWCVESIFESVRGVEEAISGYAGGKESNPTYRQVSYGQTSHTEAVEVYYDPKVVNYKTLVTVYYGSHDPTTVDGQHPDYGRQYRSMIFFQNEEEQKIAEDFKAKLESSGQYDELIATEIVPYDKFWMAEEYHQDYERRNPNQPYIRNVSIPRLRQFQKRFPELLKKNLIH